MHLKSFVVVSLSSSTTCNVDVNVLHKRCACASERAAFHTWGNVSEKNKTNKNIFRMRAKARE